jgi:hypothetical protein
MTYQQKIVALSFFSKNNLFISKFIKGIIPFYYHYFLPVLSYKPIFVEGIPSEKYIVCETQNLTITSFEEIFKHGSNIKKSQFLFFESFNRLYDICQVMQKYNLVHFNLCEETIVFSKELPYIQNFSQGFISGELTKERKMSLFEIYQPQMKHRPPSWHLFCYISQNNIPSPSLNVIDVVLQNYIDMDNFHNIFSEEFRQIWTDRLQKFIHKSKDEIFQELLKESMYWDMYSLSFLYLKYIRTFSETNSFTQQLTEFLKKTINFF